MTIKQIRAIAMDLVFLLSGFAAYADGSGYEKNMNIKGQAVDLDEVPNLHLQ